MTIRPFDPQVDYPTIVAIYNATFPSMTENEVEFRYHDDYRDAKCLFGRYVISNSAGDVVGYGDYSQSVHSYHPQKFYINIAIVPERQGEGFGKAIYDHILSVLAPHDPIALRIWTAEDQPRALRFLSDRGYTEEMRSAESWLTVAGFDPAPFAGADERVTSQGLTITTFEQIEAGDPDAREKLYHFAMEVQKDIPSQEPFQGIPYDVWAKRFDSPNYLPQAHFIAVDNGKFVGISTLWGRQSDDHLQTGVTGVVRTHRRRGIALALKLRALAYAQSVGAPIIRTDNEANNRGMLSINEALGFVKQPAWIGFVKALAEETKT